jgi:S1-C subfamily serine protease
MMPRDRQLAFRHVSPRIFVFLILVACVAPVEQRSELDSVSVMADPEKSLVPELGIVGVEIDKRIAAAAGALLGDPYGIIVVARAAGAAGEIPIQPKDVIRSMNNRKMPTLDALREAMHSLKPGEPVTLQIQREGKLVYVSFTVD